VSKAEDYTHPGDCTPVCREVEDQWRLHSARSRQVALLTKERDDARGKVAAVEALLDGITEGRDPYAAVSAAQIRAALRG
jgi:hypothetical protein